MEQICFELVDIEVTFLDKEILKIDRLAVHQFDRIGIVGKNGAGKSTLLKLLVGIIHPTKGMVNAHVECGYFEQVEPPKEYEATREVKCTERLRAVKWWRTNKKKACTIIYALL